jgi:hypothetical protein
VTSPRPWTEEDDATLRRLHGSGMALSSISKEMGRAKATVSKHADSLGLSFDRTITAAATHAAKVDAKSRQATLELGLLTDVEKSRLMFGGIETMRDFQAFGQGLDATVRAYANFKRTIPDDGGLEESKGIVGAIFGAVLFTVRAKGFGRLNGSTGELTETGKRALAAARVDGLPIEWTEEGPQWKE